MTSPATGLIATGVAVSLAVALGLVARGWDSQRADYEERIRDLSQAAAHAQAGLRAELATCRAVSEARRAAEESYAARTLAPADARRLLERQPEGIDACARMESADRAVLSNLKP